MPDTKPISQEHFEDVYREANKIDDTTIEFTKTTSHVEKETKTLAELFEEEMSLENQLAAYTHNMQERLAQVRSEIDLARAVGVKTQEELLEK